MKRLTYADLWERMRSIICSRRVRAEDAWVREFLKDPGGYLEIGCATQELGETQSEADAYAAGFIEWVEWALDGPASPAATPHAEK